MTDLTVRPAELRKTAGNESTGVLKIIALVFMFCDHAGKMLLPQIPEMRILGRIAFPLYIWALVVGTCYTRSMPKYILRVLAVGILSEPIYIHAMGHQTPVKQYFGLNWYYPNIFLTMALGLAALWGIRKKRYLSQIWAPLLAMYLSVVLNADYSWKGVLLIILLYAARNSRGAIAAVMVAFCLYWGSTSAQIKSFFGVPLVFDGAVGALLSPWLRLQAMAILALPLMLWDCPWRKKMPVWLSYAIYPAHLLVLWALEHLLR